MRNAILFILVCLCLALILSSFSPTRSPSIPTSPVSVMVWEVSYPVTDAEGNTLMLRREVWPDKDVNLLVVGTRIKISSGNDLEGMFLVVKPEEDLSFVPQELSSMSEFKLQIRLVGKRL
jgi:hypothetical protein